MSIVEEPEVPSEISNVAPILHSTSPLEPGLVGLPSEPIPLLRNHSHPTTPSHYSRGNNDGPIPSSSSVTLEHACSRTRLWQLSRFPNTMVTHGPMLSINYQNLTNKKISPACNIPWFTACNPIFFFQISVKTYTFSSPCTYKSQEPLLSSNAWRGAADDDRHRYVHADTKYTVPSHVIRLYIAVVLLFSIPL